MFFTVAGHQVLTHKGEDAYTMGGNGGQAEVPEVLRCDAFVAVFDGHGAGRNPSRATA